MFKANYTTFPQQHELRISNLEDVLGQLTEKYEVFFLTFHGGPNKLISLGNEVHCGYRVHVP